MRLPLAILLAALAALLASAILGEYELQGGTAVVSGVMLALVIGELAVVVAGRRDVVLGIACAVLVAGSIMRAAWIFSAEDWSFVPTGAWFGAGLGAVTALFWAGPRRPLRGSARPEDGSPEGP